MRVRRHLSLTLLVIMLFGAGSEAQNFPALPAGIRLLHEIDAPKLTVGCHTGFVNRGKEFVALCDDSIRVWDAKTGELRHSWPGTFKAITTSGDGNTVAAINNKLKVILFDVSTRREVWQFAFTDTHPKQSIGRGDNDTAVLSFSPDGRRLAIGCFGELEVWAVANRKFMYRFDRNTGWYFGVIEYFPDGRQFFMAGFPTYVAGIWNAQTGENERRLLLSKYTESARLAPDAGFVAAGVNYGESYSALSFFPVRNENSYRTMEIESPANGLTFSRDGKVLLSTCHKNTFLLVHTKSFQVVDKISTGDWRPFSPMFAPDGRTVAVGGSDARIRLYDISNWLERLSEYEKLSAERLEDLWKQLADDDVEQSERSPIYQLIAAPEQAVSFLASKLQPEKRPNEKEVRIRARISYRISLS